MWVKVLLPKQDRRLWAAMGDPVHGRCGILGSVPMHVWEKASHEVCPGKWVGCCVSVYPVKNISCNQANEDVDLVAADWICDVEEGGACYEAISYACNTVFNKSLPEVFVSEVVKLWEIGASSVVIPAFALLYVFGVLCQT